MTNCSHCTFRYFSRCGQMKRFCAFLSTLFYKIKIDCLYYINMFCSLGNGSFLLRLSVMQKCFFLNKLPLLSFFSAIWQLVTNDANDKFFIEELLSCIQTIRTHVHCESVLCPCLSQTFSCPFNFSSSSKEVLFMQNGSFDLNTTFLYYSFVFKVMSQWKTQLLSGLRLTETFFVGRQLGQILVVRQAGLRRPGFAS